MATYKGIKGTAVQNYAGDLSGAADGQIWYDSTATDFKYQYVVTAGGWATGNAMNTARYNLAAGGTPTAGLAFGGEVPPLTAVTESYDGTSWTEVNDLNSARQELAGNGTQTSALAYGGRVPAVSALTESWNGTNWTEVNDLGTARRYLGGAGADNTSALAFGGPNAAPGGTNQALTESWNGTNWTEVNDLNSARAILAGTGIVTSALAIGGDMPPASPINVALTESWNGTNWTEVNDLNTGRSQLSAFGTVNTAAVAFGGVNPDSGPEPSIFVLVEDWNGTNWTETTDLNTGRKFLGGTGSQAAGLAIGGLTPSVTGATEEWNKPQTVIKTLTD